MKIEEINIGVYTIRIIPNDCIDIFKNNMNTLKSIDISDLNNEEIANTANFLIVKLSNLQKKETK